MMSDTRCPQTDNLRHCGYVAIIGRPNVGKSTLLNRILGQKISITSPKAQTTRHRILGIKTSEDAQIVYVDTPGWQRSEKRAIHRYMNRAATGIVTDVDAIIFVVEGIFWTDEDQWILGRLSTEKSPIILAVNKIDRIQGKDGLLPHLSHLSDKLDFAAMIPLSARSGENVSRLEAVVKELMPVSPCLFPEEQITDRSERFQAAELIREKLMRLLGREVPYSLTVEIERFSMEKRVLHIDALIWVERAGQKAIVIGKHGAQLKMIGSQARQAMEKAFGCKIFLRLWVKVKEAWADDARALRNFGYHE